MKTNVLYYGDNLDILRHHIPDNSIDLIYLDPPFNSQATYNVLFREESGAVSHAQIEAFEDTWHWASRPRRLTTRSFAARISRSLACSGPWSTASATTRSRLTSR